MLSCEEERNNDFYLVKKVQPKGLGDYNPNNSPLDPPLWTTYFEIIIFDAIFFFLKVLYNLHLTCRAHGYRFHPSE